MFGIYRNKSEELFAKYLESNGITQFDYEKGWTHTKVKPDFYFLFSDEEVICDVVESNYKQKKSTIALQNASNDVELFFAHKAVTNEHFPNKIIRDKIRDKDKQLKPFSSQCVNLVILAGRVDECFESPVWVYQAMYGDVNFSYVIDNKTKQTFPINLFTRDGQIRKGEKEYLSSVIILRELDNEEIGLIVFENYFAKKKLPSNLFCGDFDIRYGVDNNCIMQKFIGRQISNNEEFQQFRLFFQDNKIYSYPI